MWSPAPYYMIECYEYDYQTGYDGYYEAGGSSADWEAPPQAPRCWHGPSCVFLARGVCQYFHPPADYAEERVEVQHVAAPRTRPPVRQQQTSKPWNQLVVSQPPAEATELTDETTESRESSPQDDTPPPPRQESTPPSKRRRSERDTRDRGHVRVAGTPRRKGQNKTVEIPEDANVH
mmetsp:Transcript_107205/g.201821  ORF Transcript_107205/g.201821 Transcript_107205/m.201821 type:complete len:177 (+) Transcript_107205:107-637(+)